MREIKFRFHFDNHAPVDFTLEELMAGSAFINLWRENAGKVTSKRQYTGLKDKNGKEIYGSDLIKDLVSGKTLEVKFGQSGLGDRYTGWYAEGEAKQYRINNDSDSDRNSSIEIIGNIYENR